MTQPIPTRPPSSTPADARRDSLIDYPSEFPIKVMGAKVDGFVHAMTTIAREFDPAFDAASIELRDSNSIDNRAASQSSPMRDHMGPTREVTSSSTSCWAVARTAPRSFENSSSRISWCKGTISWPRGACERRSVRFVRGWRRDFVECFFTGALLLDRFCCKSCITKGLGPRPTLTRARTSSRRT